LNRLGYYSIVREFALRSSAGLRAAVEFRECVGRAGVLAVVACVGQVVSYVLYIYLASRTAVSAFENFAVALRATQQRRAFCGTAGGNLHEWSPEVIADLALIEPGFTLGHENAGWIEAIGPGVQGWEIGQAVAISPV
jgi:hypothetical protein